MSRTFRSPPVAATALLIAALLTATGCGSSRAPVEPIRQTAPEWTTRPPTAAGMLFAVGSAQRGDRDRAIAAARAELASEIEISVESDREDRERSDVAGDDTGRRTESFDHEMRAQARSRVAQEHLPGVVVRETCEVDDRSFALVAMDRAAWAAALRTRLQELDARLQALTTQPPEGAAAPPAAAAVRCYQRLVPVIAERDEIAGRLRVADPAASIPTPPVDLVQLGSDLQQVLAQTSITIAPEAGSEAMRPLASEACAKQGLRVEPDRALAQMLARIAITTDTTHVGSEFRADGTLRADVVEPATQRLLGSVTISERASGLDEATAHSRLLTKLATRLASELDQHLLAYIARW
ncbi:MAG: LPP20 family lipoprotein [Planctomycetes bacterium]|nr:LPP20 family lipoprotein [Planctomycetota bacterium]